MSELTIYREAQALNLQDDASNIERLIDLFLANNDVKESSRIQYRRTIRPFFNWIRKRSIPLDSVNRVHILQFKEDIQAAGISSATVNSYLTAVRKFYEFVESIKLYPNVAKGVKGSRNKKQFRKHPLSESQSKSLIQYAKGASNLRDFAIVSLLLRTGLRTIEVVRLNVEDITYKGDKRVLLIHGKGRDEKDNFVKLTDVALEPITRYLDTRGKVKAGEPLFTCVSRNNKNGRLTTRTISKIAKESLKGIGLGEREFTAHSLRHTTAVNLIRAGASYLKVQKVLRHVNLATTQIYTYSIDEETRLKEDAEELLDNVY